MKSRWQLSKKTSVRADQPSKATAEFRIKAFKLISSCFILFGNQFYKTKNV